ncbi:hypothetical protein [Cellulomonas edaphi]|uniref:ABC transporter permease n=1 Tax=Cellulomonas edaphi TaxID=3053468 RepID=A0ABT7S4Y9_9CELL|nr:hypothetical protein [Cellulomons edaphi]MDM7830672.1 hypothetical protein [Cellulomons edaphi]
MLLPAALVAAVAAAVLGTRLLPGGAPALTDPTVIRVVLGSVAYLVGIALIGLALGVMLRSTAGAVAAVLGAVMILPAILGTVLADSWSRVIEVLPSSAGDALVTTGHVDGVLAPLLGGADFVAWVAMVLALAAVSLTRRDA